MSLTARGRFWANEGAAVHSVNAAAARQGLVYKDPSQYGYVNLATK